MRAKPWTWSRLDTVVADPVAAVARGNSELTTVVSNASIVALESIATPESPAVFAVPKVRLGAAKAVKLPIFTL